MYFGINRIYYNNTWKKNPQKLLRIAEIGISYCKSNLTFDKGTMANGPTFPAGSRNISRKFPKLVDRSPGYFFKYVYAKKQPKRTLNLVLAVFLYPNHVTQVSSRRGQGRWSSWHSGSCRSRSLRE